MWRLRYVALRYVVTSVQLASESRNNLSKKFEELLLTFVLLCTWALLDRRAKVSNLNILTIVSLCIGVILFMCLTKIYFIAIWSTFYYYYKLQPWCVSSILLWIFSAEQKKLRKYFVLNMKTTLFSFNPILHTAWLEKYALTLRNYFGENSSFCIPF